MAEKLKLFHKTGDIITVKVQFNIPSNKFLAKYEKITPKLKYHLLSMLSISKEQGNCILQIKGSNLNLFWENFVKLEDPKTYQEIFRDDNVILINIFIKSPWALWTIMERQIIIKFPINIYKGLITINLIAPKKKIDEIFKKPYWKKLGIKIIHIGYCLTPKLPKHQEEILINACKYGLFDIPRKKSLTQAAKLMKISVSALSENLRRISKNFAENYLGSGNFEKK